ncbi:MAG TPA: rhomboid family intramembrane serine protease [Flavipsychrobacter sp.]|nr:rhomboid family intramembrane serine protease [Flavipsychrobacter sp.]
MKTIYRKSSQSLIPPYSENGALQLIVASGATFVAFHFWRIIMLVAGKDKAYVFDAMFPNFGLSSVELFQRKFWTILTYGWLHHGFMEWVSNMIWLYCFASVLQKIAGFKQIIPLFVFALLVGGGFYLGSQFLPHDIFQVRNIYFMGSQAGVIALGFAAITLEPRYRLHLTPTFSIPLALILGIYVVLDLVVYLPNQGNALMLCVGGILTGSLFGMAIKKGYDPGEWVYATLGKVPQITTPNEHALANKKSRKRVDILRTMYEPKRGISQERIDEILDKINDKGYHALSREEKDILFRAGKE